MSYYDIKITGKDVKRFIHNLHKMHIKLLNIDFKPKCVIIRVLKEDYLKIKKIKTIYEVEVIRIYGIEKYKYILMKYKLFFIMLTFSFILFITLTNIIFEVEVVHNNKEIRNMILEELKDNGISKYHFVISYNKKEKIKKNILNKYKNEIEWLEIERQGTKYQVKVEERKIKKEDKDTTPRNIVALKDGLIYNITSTAGEIVAKKDMYVKKGDILISGVIHNKDKIVGYVRSEGNIIAEVWYTVTVELPYHYHEEKKLNNSQTILEIKWFNKNIDLFSHKKYKYSSKNNIFSLNNPILPISIGLKKEEELEVIDKLYTKANAIVDASSIAKSKLKSKLGNNIEIIYEKNLKIEDNHSKIVVVMFYKVLENITDYQNIEEIIIE